MNFGECKGLTFDRILIFPNKPFLEYIQKGKAFGSPEKYYIAVTRPRFSIAIAVDKFPLKSKFQFNDITISVGSRHISCKKSHSIKISFLAKRLFKKFTNVFSYIKSILWIIFTAINT